MVTTIEVLNRDTCVCKLARLARSRTYMECIDNIGRLVQQPLLISRYDRQPQLIANASNFHGGNLDDDALG